MCPITSPARLRFERLPAYAPDLNPDQGIWNYHKRVELRKLCCRSLRDRREALREAAVRLCRKLEIIQGCLREAGYHL
jgi:transposase